MKSASYASIQAVPRIHTRTTRAFKRVPTCHIGSAVHFHCTVAFKGQEATVSKMDSWTYVTCGYLFESSCLPGVDSGTQINAHVTLISSKSVSMWASLRFLFLIIYIYITTSVPQNLSRFCTKLDVWYVYGQLLTSGFAHDGRTSASRPFVASRPNNTITLRLLAVGQK